jgi:hypothetical protein
MSTIQAQFKIQTSMQSHIEIKIIIHDRQLESYDVLKHAYKDNNMCDMTDRSQVLTAKVWKGQRNIRIYE